VINLDTPKVREVEDQMKKLTSNRWVAWAPRFPLYISEAQIFKKSQEAKKLYFEYMAPNQQA
jgi:hypothetical protein